MPSSFPDTKTFFIRHNGLVFSKLGIGTFNKEPYKEENYVFDYIAGVKEAVLQGINLIDTASNYRYGESEREIGIALQELFDEGITTRESLILCSKGGFIPLSYPFPENPYAWIDEQVIQSGLAQPEDIELDQHCMTPDFLEWSCRESLKRVGVDSFDIYYLHNPEMQYLRLGEKGFYKAIEKAFERFEQLADEGCFQYYGVATWNGFINQKMEKLDLERMVKIARKVGGDHHRFRYIQTPFNMAKTDIYTMPTQTVNGEACTLLQAAHRLGIGVLSSSSLLQMNLFHKSFSAETGAVLDRSMTLTSDIQLALQFVRSTPGIVSSLFGSIVPVHIRHNCEISAIKSIPQAQYNLLYRL